MWSARARDFVSSTPVLARSSLLLLGVLAIAAAAHAADRAPAGTVRAIPDRAGSASKLVVHADGASAGLRSRQAPRRVTLALARGFRFDPAAVSARCTDDQAKRGACPARSRISRGSAAYRLEGPLPPGAPSHGTADLGGFLALGTGRLQLVIRDRGTGTSVAARGRLVRIRRGPFGTELRAALPTLPLPLGLRVSIDRIELTAGAQRRVPIARHAARTRIRHLVTNPPRCPRSRAWAAELRATYASGTEVRRASVACRP